MGRKKSKKPSREQARNTMIKKRTKSLFGKAAELASKTGVFVGLFTVDGPKCRTLTAASEESWSPLIDMLIKTYPDGEHTRINLPRLNRTVTEGEEIVMKEFSEGNKEEKEEAGNQMDEEEESGKLDQFHTSDNMSRTPALGNLPEPIITSTTANQPNVVITETCEDPYIFDADSWQWEYLSITDSASQSGDLSSIQFRDESINWQDNEKSGADPANKIQVAPAWGTLSNPCSEQQKVKAREQLQPYLSGAGRAWSQLYSSIPSGNHIKPALAIISQPSNEAQSQQAWDSADLTAEGRTWDLLPDLTGPEPQQEWCQL
ncbi:hypothetical protein B0O99DRAFT_601744 [Bisporella sp. PMI_857]|nr:hypothetical protein B0O99DRAFT_601744 [Bisporella sp. PMI_857]